MESRIEHIRESERQSHTEIYSKEVLYNSDSWLKKPIKTVQEIVPFFSQYDSLRVLDLGCGVGRNSIYIAEQFFESDCIIDCVDILDIAIEKLQIYANEHGVAERIRGYVDTIEHFKIKKASYDFIIVVSALEHVENKEILSNKLQEIEEGLRANGIVCLVINSEVKEWKVDSLENIDPQFEVNLLTDEIRAYIENTFSNYETIKNTLSNQEYDIPRDEYVSHLTTNVVTYVGRKIIT